MIILLVTLQLYGATITIDVERMYGAMSIDRCRELLPTMILEYGASGGHCWKGDILKPTENI